MRPVPPLLLAVAVIFALTGCVSATTPEAAPPTVTPSADPAPVEFDEAAAAAWIAALEAEDLVTDVTILESGVPGEYLVEIAVDEGVDRDALQAVYDSALAHAESTGFLASLEFCVCTIASGTSSRELVVFSRDVPADVDRAFDAWEWAAQLPLDGGAAVSLGAHSVVSFRPDETQLPALLTEVVEGGAGGDVLESGISIEATGFVGEYGMVCSRLEFWTPISEAEREVLADAIEHGLAGQPDVCLDVAVADEGWMLLGVYDPEGGQSVPGALDELRDRLVAVGTALLE